MHTVVDSFRKQLDGYLETGELTQNGERLYKVFNRDLTNAFLRGDLNQSMFIENPRDNSTNHVLAAKNAISVVEIYDAKQELQQERDEINSTVFDKIKNLSIAKGLLTLRFSGEVGLPLTITTVIKEDGLLLGSPINARTITLQSNQVLISSKEPNIDMSPKLLLLICDQSNIYLAEVTDADIYFKLADAYKRGCPEYVDFLKDNPRLIPWFPPVLIGKD